MKKERKNTLRDSVFEKLKALIITGQIPPGGRVTENEIAERLKVSRTPVREAFNRLERDGLVIGRPRQGYVVAEFNLTMFREAFDIRELLDGRATELAATPDLSGLTTGQLCSIVNWNEASIKAFKPTYSASECTPKVAINAPAPVVEQPVRDRPGHDRRYAIDPTLIETELGWRPLETWESGLQKTIRWYQENNQWLERARSGAKIALSRIQPARPCWPQPVSSSPAPCCR